MQNKKILVIFSILLLTLSVLAYYRQIWNHETLDQQIELLKNADYVNEEWILDREEIKQVLSLKAGELITDQD